MVPGLGLSVLLTSLALPVRLEKLEPSSSLVWLVRLATPLAGGHVKAVLPRWSWRFRCAASGGLP